MSDRVILLIMLLCLFGCIGITMADSSDAAGSPQELDSHVFVETYKKANSTHLALTESSKSAYEHVDVYIYAAGSVTVTVDGISDTYVSAGLNLFQYSFVTGSEHDLSVSFGIVSYNYHFKVMKNISPREIDEDVEEYITISESQYNTEKLASAAFAFISTFVGIYIAYKLIRKRAANEVRHI